MASDSRCTGTAVAVELADDARKLGPRGVGRRDAWLEPHAAPCPEADRKLGVLVHADILGIAPNRKCVGKAVRPEIDRVDPARGATHVKAGGSLADRRSHRPCDAA